MQVQLPVVGSHIRLVGQLSLQSRCRPQLSIPGAQ